jgi:hypothetical protein
MLYLLFLLTSAIQGSRKQGILAKTSSTPPQWEKSNKFVPLGKIKKIFF